LVLARVLALTLVGVLLVGCDRAPDGAAPAASRDSEAERAEQGQVALDLLVDALREGSRQDAVGLAAPDARGLVGWVYDNVAALQIGDLSMRYVDDRPAVDAGQQQLGPGAWRATVLVDYRYLGFDRSSARVETSAVFATTGDAARIASFGGQGQRSPLWLVTRLDVDRSDRSMLAVAGATTDRYAGLVTGALGQVRRVLPRWRGPLVVEVPASRSQLAGALSSPPGQYDGVAALTTTADGSLEPDAPVRVLVNPAVFGELEDRAAQVVLSHEATHVATGAPFSAMPTWLLEGFADFVALEDTGISVDRAAGQVLSRIRAEGVPEALPTSEDLQPTAAGLGAAYEESWLACRFLAREYGADRLLRFHRRVGQGASTKAAFRTELGTTQQAFVSRWRADLARLARVAG
jgi:hypothetical protein